MPAITPARAERAALLDLLAAAGPDAPTLLTGWTTHDLAAHLVVRDRQPLALPGLVVPPLHRVTAAFERRARQRPYDDLLAALHAGPGPLSPGALGDVAELHEWFVHHEDVRRAADPAPRETPPALEGAVWSRVQLLGPGLAARARGLGITLATPEGRRLRVRRGPREVAVAGRPTELLLWLFGRREAADVQVTGEPAAVSAAATARLGW